MNNKLQCLSHTAFLSCCITAVLQYNDVFASYSVWDHRFCSLHDVSMSYAHAWSHSGASIYLLNNADGSEKQFVHIESRNAMQHNQNIFDF